MHNGDRIRAFCLCFRNAVVFFSNDSAERISTQSIAKAEVIAFRGAARAGIVPNESFCGNSKFKPGTSPSARIQLEHSTSLGMLLFQKKHISIHTVGGAVQLGRPRADHCRPRSRRPSGKAVFVADVFTRLRTVFGRLSSALGHYYIGNLCNYEATFCLVCVGRACPFFPST